MPVLTNTEKHAKWILTNHVAVFFRSVGITHLAVRRRSTGELPV
jgi:hypothetical protein